jgi:hypothetical protein
VCTNHRDDENCGDDDREGLEIVLECSINPPCYTGERRNRLFSRTGGPPIATLPALKMRNDNDTGREECELDGHEKEYPGVGKRRLIAARRFPINLNGAAVQRLRTAFTVRTGHHYHITVGIAEPNFPVLGPGVNVRFFDDLGPQPARSLHDRVKIVYLEPQQDTVPRRRRVCVDEVGVVFLVPSVELEKQLTRARDPIVHVAVAVFWKRVCSKQFGVPATTRSNIAHRYEGLSLDG